MIIYHNLVNAKIILGQFNKNYCIIKNNESADNK